MESLSAGPGEAHATLIGLYDAHAVEIYSYLARRCRDRQLAEELCAETFLSALQALARGAVSSPSAPWRATIARNKLVDHWRRQSRERRVLGALTMESNASPTTEEFEQGRCR